MPSVRGLGAVVLLLAASGGDVAAAADPTWAALGGQAAGESFTFTAQPGAPSFTFTRTLRLSCGGSGWQLLTYNGDLVRGADGTYAGGGPIATPVYVGSWNSQGGVYDGAADVWRISLTLSSGTAGLCAGYDILGSTLIAERAEPLVTQPARRVGVPRCRYLRLLTHVIGTGSTRVSVWCYPRGSGETAAKLALVAPPRHGTVRALGGEGGWSYRPDRGFTGLDRFSFQATNAGGSTPEHEVRIRVRRPTAAEKDQVYWQGICSSAPSNTSCRAGRGRRTRGGAGTGKVTHQNWPAITGVYFSVFAGGEATLTGGDRNDELLGHHGDDRAFGRDGSDVLWGDWDPDNNNGHQRDLLVGGDGSDFIYTSHGRNTVRGGNGNDFIWAFYGHGTVDCGPGIDKVRLSGREEAYELRGCERRGKF